MVDSKMASSSETPDVLAGPPHAAQIYYNDIMAACFALVQPATSDPIYDHELAGRVVGMAVRFAKLEPPPRTEVLERLRAVADGLKNEIARSRALAGVAKGYIRCGEFVSALSITEQILTQRAANLAEILRDMVTQKCYGGLSGFVRLSSEYSQTCWLLIEGLVQAHPSDVKLIREGIGRAQEFSGPITTSGVTSAVDKWATLFGPEQENVAVWRANNTKEEMDYLLSFDDKAGEGSEDHQDAQVEGTS